MKEGKEPEKHSLLPFKSPPPPFISFFITSTPTGFITTSTIPGMDNMPNFYDHNEIIIPSRYFISNLATSRLLLILHNL